MCVLEFVSSAAMMVAMALGVCLVTVTMLKFVYRLIFPKRRKVTVGYQEQWFGKEDGPPTDEGTYFVMNFEPHTLAT